MELIKLTEQNVSDYKDFIPDEIAENIGRIHFRGIVAAEDENPLGGMVWMMKNFHGQGDPEGHIIWLRVADETAVSCLMDGYREDVEAEGIARSTVSLPARTSLKERTILADAGFETGLTEGDEIVAGLSEISELPFVKKLRVSDAIRPLHDATQRSFNRSVRRMVQKGYYGLCEDIEELPRVYFENDISCFSEEDGMINGLFLCHKRPSGRISVELMAALGKDYQKLVAQLIVCSAKAAMELYTPETEIVIDRHNYATMALGEKLFPRGFGIPVFTGSRSEKEE